jgi:copper transport protein
MRQRAVRGALVVAASVLALPAPAWAHATLSAASPDVQGRANAAPHRAMLRFTEPIAAAGTSIEVRSAGGRFVSGSTRVHGRVAWTPLRALRRGGYTVRWRALASDGHVTSGVFTFGYRTAAPQPTEAYGAVGPTLSDDLVRWAYFAAFALLLGGLGFRLLVLGGDSTPAYERRFYRVAGLGAVGVLELGLVVFLLRADDALQLPIGRFLYGDVSPFAETTRFGKAFVVMSLGYTLVAVLLFLAWLLERTVLLWASFLLGLGLVSGLSLSGHSAAAANASPLTELADWVHVAAACLWLGGVVQLAFCVWPAAGPELRRKAFLRFSRLAMVLVGVLVAAGLYLSVLRLPSVDALWSDRYGIVLLIKLALVGAALSWGGFHHTFVRPRLLAGDVSWRGRTLLAESAAGMAVLLAAAVLVNSQPPAEPGSPAQAGAARSGR